MNEQVTHYELDMSEPEEPNRPTLRRQVLLSRRNLAIAASFVLGLAIGVAGLDKHHDSAAARARQNEISLIALFGDVSDSREFSYEIQLYNNGPLPVGIGEARLIAPEYEAVPADAALEPAGRMLSPGRWLLLQSVPGSPMCPVEPTPSSATLAVEVTTEAGEIRQVEVPLLDRHDQFAAARRSECQALLYPETTINAYHAGSMVNSDATVTVTIYIDSWGRRPVDIVAIEPRDDIEIQLLDPLPLTIPPRGTQTLEVKVLELPCDAAPALQGTELTMTAQAGEAAMTHTVWINPWASPLLGADQTCDGPG